jgi:peptide/nickel transport system substrate-binding protein
VAGYVTWYPTDVYDYGTGAWHNLAPAFQAEADGKMAFSPYKSENAGIVQTSLIAGPTLAIQSSYIDYDVTSGFIPYYPTMSQYITPDEAKIRYANLQAFYAAHNILWIGTGPYQIDKVSTEDSTITVHKFYDYRFFTNRWSNLEVPEIAEVRVDGPATVKAGDNANFTVMVSFNGAPYPANDLDKVSYTLFGTNGEQVTSGIASLSPEGVFIINIPSSVTMNLPAGSALLNVAVSPKVVVIPSFSNFKFVMTN